MEYSEDDSLVDGIDWFLMRPVLAGLWRHRDVVENVFTVNDLMDAHEMLDARQEAVERPQD